MGYTRRRTVLKVWNMLWLILLSRSTAVVYICWDITSKSRGILLTIPLVGSSALKFGIYQTSQYGEQ
jgi:hypothetical protein